MERKFNEIMSQIIPDKTVNELGKLIQKLYADKE